MSQFSKILKYILPHVKKHKTSCIAVFTGYGVGVLLDNILKPYLYKNIIDELSSGKSPDVILQNVMSIVFLIIGVIILHNIGYRLGDYANSFFQSKVMKELHDQTFNRLLKHSYNFFSNSFSGGLVAKAKRFTRSFEILSDVISFQIWFSFISLLGVIVVLLVKIPIFAYLFIIWSILYVAIVFFFIKKKIKLDIQEAEADSKVTGHLADAIVNILNIKVFTSSKHEDRRFNKVTSEEEGKRRKAWYFGNLQNAVQATFMGVLQVTILILSVKLWYRGELSIGMIVLLQTYMFNIFDILWNLGRSMTKAIKALTDMKEVVDIFETTPDILDPINPEVPKIKDGVIEFKNVSFGYTEGIDVLNNFNFKIEKGQKIGLVGHSGSGKSTITKLLLRFVDVDSGEILIDGQNISNITQDDLRSAISYVPQESILFHRSIRENIGYSRENSTNEEIEEAAKFAHADDFINDLPKGYNTLVGERGIKLSGGERQRVSIARAMLKDSPILVLDEATSSLDSISEKYIQESFTKLMEGRTTVVIAHRFSTIQKMDRIIVLDKGQIVEEGTHTELLKKNGQYADLWNHQVGGFIE